MNQQDLDRFQRKIDLIQRLRLNMNKKQQNVLDLISSLAVDIVEANQIFWVVSKDEKIRIYKQQPTVLEA